jgi:signal transduction histidine kinase
VSFGGVESVKEACRDARGVRFLEDLAQDVAYGLRSLRRNPGFAAVVVLTLALGIGANTAMFSVVNTVLLRPLPYEGGNAIMVLRQSAAGAGVEDIGLSALEVQDYRTQAASLDGVVEYHSMNFTLLGGAEPRRVQTGVVSWNFFDVLGVKPALGRGFRPGDEMHGADAVLLLSHEFWKAEFGGDPGAVGRRFEMNDRAHTVIGVLPPLPRYPDANDVFMPTVACPFRSRPATAENRQARMVAAFARVKTGVSLAQARSDVQTVAERLRSEYPEAYSRATGYRADLLPLREELVRQARQPALDETARNYTQRIVRSAEQMDALILDLLAYGRVARVEMSFTTVRLQSAWDVALAQNERAIEETKAHIKTIPPLPAIRAHESTLGQILANLLSNALKFVDVGTAPSVVFRAEEKPGWVRLWIEDNGIGIAPDHWERIFRVFERLHGTAYAGTGIGLSIVRKGVERMGGRLGLESAPGRGSKFWIELPKG